MDEFFNNKKEICFNQGYKIENDSANFDNLIEQLKKKLDDSLMNEIETALITYDYSKVNKSFREQILKYVTAGEKCNYTLVSVII